MTIATQHWQIQLEDAVGTNKREIKVSGAVMVPTSAYRAELVVGPDHSDTHLHLDIKLTEEPEFGATPQIYKPVTFSRFDLIQYQSIAIYHERELVLSITGLQSKS
ncbi:hypothetical protein [Pseudomonas ovata]|uniref:hypothetical protein n=1 Tax=Pseudomonas ovata TaxID=1839709 RepID=UPI000D69958A|nr:hypothetical protein [Pseudomonas ovata]